MVTLVLLTQPVQSPHATASYDPPASLEDAEPGDLLRWQPMPNLNGHPAWRILYASTDLDGSLIPVSGLIALPDHLPPAGGFPLLAIGHPTSGVARACAPSLFLLEETSEMANVYAETLAPYLDAGYALVMTDYQGLGAAGSPSYVIGELEGRNILDSIRAARHFPETKLSDQVVLTGHSQGGHAVAFAMELAPDYAPELSFDGAVLLAPAIDLAGIFQEILGGGEASSNTALALFVASAWSETYPEAALEQIVTPVGQLFIETFIDQTCLEGASVASALVSPSELFRAGATETWTELLERNRPGAGPWSAPVFIAHGEADDVIDQRFTANYVEAHCAAGSTIEYRTYPGTSHFPLLAAAENDVLAWVASRFAGDEAGSTCEA